MSEQEGHPQWDDVYEHVFTQMNAGMKAELGEYFGTGIGKGPSDHYQRPQNKYKTTLGEMVIKEALISDTLPVYDRHTDSRIDYYHSGFTGDEATRIDNAVVLTRKWLKAPEWEQKLAIAHPERRGWHQPTVEEWATAGAESGARTFSKFLDTVQGWELTPDQQPWHLRAPAGEPSAKRLKKS